MMTKEEFDVEFMSGLCVIQADTMEEWREINQYCVEQLSLRKSEMYVTHDCKRYPYVYRRDSNFVGALRRPESRRAIPFCDFLTITQSEEEELPCITLDGVL